MWARGQEELAAALAKAPSAQIAAALSPSAPGLPGVPDDLWRAFRERFAAHLARFGHAIYDLDFAKAVPVDDPAPLLDALKFFLTGQAADPYVRQMEAAQRRREARAAIEQRLRGPRLALFRKLLGTAQRFAPLREDALADVGLGWPILRRMLRELGRRLAAAGAIGEADDVFWLTYTELRAAATALDAGQAPSSSLSTVAERRATWERQRPLTPPVALPLDGGTKYLGIDFRRVMPARTEQAAGATITGIGTSPGQVTAPACVLRGPEEFDQMRPGAILVAKITTPAWTPLFALAAGVVTDVGGPLSHSSIVAREYHIPAVLGTGVATERIVTGQRITVDGDAGTVQLLS
jgi:pyruvate,water dikinase